MEFGVQFFPDVGPAEKSAEQYWAECLRLVDLVDELGYSHVRTVEHHFNAYGGYSPNPHIFLAAASQRTKRARLVTGAVLPVFNHPLKIAGEIGELDAISGGRLDSGFGRAFLPLEFARFGVSLDESQARFDEGIGLVKRLLSEENVSVKGRFHQFDDVTTLPRPVQQPHPPFWIAAFATPESFINAGKNGYSVMAIPLAGGKMGELMALYRDAWQQAGHPGQGRIMLAFHMYCAHDTAAAIEIARDPLNNYLKSLVAAASDWSGGSNSADYKGYDKLIATIAKDNIDTQIEKGAAWIGSPKVIVEQIKAYQAATGGFESASLQINFNTLPIDLAEQSMRLFGEQVLPHFK